MGRKPNDLTGQRYGRLTVVQRHGSNKRGDVLWLCVCDCGREAIVASVHLRGGGTKSCGCLQRERASASHPPRDKTREKLYSAWYSMIRRCYNEKSQDYIKYGARGISVCEEWKANFESFYDWALTHGYQEGLTIDRINNDGNYCPGNCRWSTMKAQQNNRRNNRLITYNGRTQTVAQWADEFGIPYKKLNHRISKYGWDIEKALTTP